MATPEQSRQSRIHSGRVVPPRATVPGNISTGHPRLRCADVARNRAQRYARRHRNARPFLPLISAAILVTLLFERRSFVREDGRRKLPDARQGKTFSAGAADDGGAIRLGPVETNEGHEKDSGPQYRPSSRFLAKDVAQVVAFLIRNRGRLDTNVVRAK